MDRDDAGLLGSAAAAFPQGLLQSGLRLQNDLPQSQDFGIADAQGLLHRPSKNGPRVWYLTPPHFATSFLNF
jgi:hypothetical protein